MEIIGNIYDLKNVSEFVSGPCKMLMFYDPTWVYNLFVRSRYDLNVVWFRCESCVSWRMGFQILWFKIQVIC